MKLYNKQLSSLEALRGEKIRLRTELRHADKPELNPLAALGTGDLSGIAKGGLLGLITELFSAKSDIQTAMAIIKPVMNLFGKKSRRSAWDAYAPARPEKKSFLTRVLADVAVGYLTGKTVQLAFIGAGMLLRKRKRKKAMKHPIM